jgi:ankyrin repeat protein
MDVLNQVQPGTGKWLLTHAAFLHCLATPATSQMLWLAGIPGSGKTSLASIVIDHLEREFKQSDVGIVYVFCDYKDSTQTSDNLKRVILRQLLHQLDGLPREVEKLYQVHARRSTNPSSSELDDALRPTICLFTRLFLVIDGLDELSELHGASDSLLKLCKELCPNIQALITSRWTVGLKDHIQRAAHVEVFAQDQDISTYLEHEIRSRSRLQLFVRKDPAFKDQIVGTILGNCKGMFLVARLHIKSLAGKPHLRAAKLALKSLPSTLDGVYENAIHRIKKQSEDDVVLAWRVLSWIVRTIKPLSSEQLQHALAVDETCNELDADALIDMDLILSVCAGLVVLDSQDSAVRLVHYTAQEFFERHGSNLLPETDHDIAFTCLRYLSFRGTKGVSASDQDLIKKITSFPFLEYAASSWGEHVAKCSSRNVELDSLVERFLNDDTCRSGALQIMLMPKSKHEGFSQHVTKKIHGLHLAAHFGLTGIVEKLVEVHNVDTRDEAGRSPLHWAARAGHSLTAKLLLQKYGEADAPDCVNGTPLHLASRYSHPEVVLVLIENGCDVNKCNNVGGTALIWSAIGGSQDVATILLKHGADVHARTTRGSTALHKAVQGNHEAMVQILLRHDAEVDSMDEKGSHTPLLAATSNSNEAIMHMLLEVGALPDFKIKAGGTALHCAATRRTDGPTRVLLHFGANPNERDSLGRTPLHLAVHHGNLTTMLMLMSVARLDVVDNYDKTLLHAAVNPRTENMDGKLVRILLNTQKIDIDAIDTNGWSALTYATYNGLPNITKLLLDAGANPVLQSLAVQALEESHPSASRKAPHQSTPG